MCVHMCVCPYVGMLAPCGDHKTTLGINPCLPQCLKQGFLLFAAAYSRAACSMSCWDSPVSSSQTGCRSPENIDML